MTDLERVTEDAVDAYAWAVKSGKTDEFFRRVAAERLELDEFHLSRRDARGAIESVIREGRACGEALSRLLDRLENLL